MPTRVKEWAYAGFAFTLISAVVAHLSVGDGAAQWGSAVATAVLCAISYGAWRKRLLKTGP